ncbi:MAG: TonB family protein, partial [Fulvivirga sp.]
RPIEARKKAAKRSAISVETPSASGLAMNYAPQTPTISGKVTSIDDGQPLPGVNVMVKGTTIGTVTDIDGRFEIANIEASERDALVISFIGLATEEIEIGDRSQIDVQMGSDVSQLSEVVVVGYGAASETDNSINTWNNSRPSISMAEYKDYLKKNTRYDSSQNVKGKVAVKFDILENGQLTNFEIKRSLSYYYDQEAIRLIKEGPEWLPAEQNGNKVKSTARVTVKFDKGE